MPGMAVPPGPPPMGPGGMGLDAGVSPPALGAADATATAVASATASGRLAARTGSTGQGDIETAAAIMEKALEIVLDDEHSTKRSRWPSRTCCCPAAASAGCAGSPKWPRSRSADPVMGGPLALPDGTPPDASEVKVWEQVGDEYVYWEDFLVRPGQRRPPTPTGSPSAICSPPGAGRRVRRLPSNTSKLKADGRLGDILKWTEESAAKSAGRRRLVMKTAEKLGDHVKKAMVWEIWDRTEPQDHLVHPRGRRHRAAHRPRQPTSCRASSDPGPDAVGPHHRQPHPAAVLRPLRQAGRGSRRDFGAHLRPDQADQGPGRLQRRLPRDRRASSPPTTGK